MTPTSRCGLAIDEQLLTHDERNLIEGSDSAPTVSAVSIWELRLKWNSFFRSGERKGRADPGVVMGFATAMGWDLLPLTADHAAADLSHPLSHRDPFDELLLVQAQEEGMRLLTRDAKLAGHPLAIAG